MTLIFPEIVWSSPLNSYIIVLTEFVTILNIQNYIVHGLLEWQALITAYTDHEKSISECKVARSFSRI